MYFKQLGVSAMIKAYVLHATLYLNGIKKRSGDYDAYACSSLQEAKDYFRATAKRYLSNADKAIFRILDDQHVPLFEFTEVPEKPKKDSWFSSI